MPLMGWYELERVVVPPIFARSLRQGVAVVSVQNQRLQTSITR